MDLSRYFTLAEMTHSDTAARENIPNQPPPPEIAHLHALCSTVLDPLRAEIARPIRVNSGYRGPALNARIGGARKSQHLEGKAADIQSPGMSVIELFKTIIRLDLPFDQLIYEAQSRTAKWVHVSYDLMRARRQIMVAQFGADGRPRGYPVITVQAALEMREPATRSGGAAPLTYIEMADEPESASEPELPVAAPAKRKRAAATKKRKRKQAKTGQRTSAKKRSARKRVASSSRRTPGSRPGPGPSPG